MMVRSLLCCGAAAVLVLSSAAAAAHNYHMGIADISYNERTGSTEIVHTYTAHDVATLLTKQAGRVVDLGQPGSEALLRKYAEKQFTVSGRKGERLPLTWIGMKADADSVVIFQEIARTRLGAGSRIHNAVLTDLIPAQKNTVNVQVDGPVKTLIFDQGSLDQVVP